MEKPDIQKSTTNSPQGALIFSYISNSRWRELSTCSKILSSVSATLITLEEPKTRTMKKLSILIMATLVLGIFSCQEEQEPNQLPTCIIIQPVDSASFFVGESVDIRVNAEDGDGTVEEVRYYVDDVGIASVESFPFNYQWSTDAAGAGEHVIKAEVIDNEGGKASDMVSVIILGIRPPVADFTADSTTPMVGQVVTFTDLSQEDPDAWFWDFGDGSTSAEQHPQHSYDLSGEYSVTLVVSNEAGADSITRNSYIQVSEPLDEATMLVEYLESVEGGNYANTGLPSLKTASHVKTLLTTGDNYIIDIRTADDFALGHIPNAVNVPVSEVLAHLEATTGDDDKEIHIVDYSGQTACWVACAAAAGGIRQCVRHEIRDVCLAPGFCVQMECQRKQPV